MNYALLNTFILYAPLLYSVDFVIMFQKEVTPLEAEKTPFIILS